MTEPASSTQSTPAPTPDEPPNAVLRVLTTDDDLACVDDLCLVVGPRAQLRAADEPTPRGVPETFR